MNAVDHNNVVIFDDRGIPSIMCRFVRPKDTEEVPAVFKIGDKVADAIYISKYPNIVIDGRAYSMPMADPTVNITFDGAVQACRCKGLGWHLMTAVEYEYLLNQSREKGTMPHGNTDWGKDYYHNDEQGKVSNLGRTYTGTGPVTWNHDHTPYGVSDLNGNVWEWLAGLRIKDGVIEFIPDNKAASPYLDNWTNKEQPEDKPLLPANVVVLLSTEANYSMYYGAVGVTDEAGKTIEVVEGSRIPEQWVERRPPRRFLQLNSAPLCVPHEVDSWYVATVC